MMAFIYPSEEVFYAMKIALKYGLTDHDISIKKTFPDSEYRVKKLVLKNKGINDINEVPYLSELTGLEILVLNDNNIESAGSLTNLVNLKFLNLSGNKISKVENFGKLKKLECLYLDGNPIESIDFDDLHELTNLRVIDLGKEACGRAKAEVILNKIEHLKSRDYVHGLFSRNDCRRGERYLDEQEDEGLLAERYCALTKMIEEIHESAGRLGYGFLIVGPDGKVDKHLLKILSWLV